MNKKGFLFVVTIFLILTYILLSISVWVKGIETSERRYSEFYRESTIELSLQQITPERVDNISNIIMYRSLARLNDHTFTDPVKSDPVNQNRYINRSMHQLLVNGSASGDNFLFGTAIPNENTSLKVWAANLNASLLAVGVSLNDFRIENFNIVQTDINRLNYSFDLIMRLSDTSNTIAVSKNYKIKNSLDITGFVDPALQRESASLTSARPIYRQFFFNRDLSDPRALGVEKSPSASMGGQGWFYGPLAGARPSSSLVYGGDIPTAKRKNYILVGTFSEIRSFADRLDFGAYIVTSPPSYTDDACGSRAEESNTFNALHYSSSGRGASATCDASIKSCLPEDASCMHTWLPFIVVPNFNASSDAYICPKLSNHSFGGERCALMVSNNLPEEIEGLSSSVPSRKLNLSGDAQGVYGIERVRDFVMCGYYLKNPAAPSYLQRLFNDSYSLSSPDFGIETFVIGEYVNSTAYNTRSRLDRELFTPGVATVKIRGLPGCRNYDTCRDSPTTGIFMVSRDDLITYSSSLGMIDCNSGARCG